MSGRDWKPGEVGTFGGTPALRTSKGWTHFDGSVGGLHQDTYDVRPLAVIDPDSPKDQRRLLSLLRNSGAFRGVVAEGIALDCIGDALREFASPKSCDAVLYVGSERIECERDNPFHLTDHRNDSIGQGVRWSA